MKLKTVYFLLTACLLRSEAKAQEQLSLRDKANQYYNQFQYSKAVVFYQKALNTKRPYLKDLQRLADSYDKMNDYANAEKWYALVITDPNRSDENILAYAEVLKKNGLYQDAKNAFREYATKTGTNQDLQVASCDSAVKWMGKPTSHLVKNQENINSPLSEFSIFNNGMVNYLAAESPTESAKTYDWTGKSFLRIFSVYINPEKNLNKPLLLENKFNSGTYHVGPITSNKQGNVLYITRTFAGKQNDIERVGARKYYTKNLELMIYRKDKKSGEWLEEAFKYNKVNAYSVGHAALSADEKTLYFVSDMPGGFGGTDIWYCELQADASWGVPKNCGVAINTAQNELFPTVSDNTLYFSTEGRVGMGGLDIFSSTKNANTWSEPVNLHYPLNSPQDDFGFVEATGTTGYFSSNRKGGKGGDDIYSYTYTSPIVTPKPIVFALDAMVLDKNSDEPVSNVSLTLYADGKKLIEKGNSNINGKIYFTLQKDIKYTLLGRRGGYLPDSTTLSTAGLAKSDTLDVVMKLDPLTLGKTVRLDNIFYDMGKDNIRPDAAKVLDGLEQLLRENPTINIELSSHTDSRGNEIDNLLLSQRRAQSAVNYLISKGIAKKRLVPIGYGAVKLINKCNAKTPCSEKEHQVNRRTEFTILKM